MNAKPKGVDEKRQISFRATPEIKRKARIEAAKQGLSISEWFLQIVVEKLPKTED